MEREPKQGAQYRFTYEMIHEILALPKHWTIVGIVDDTRRDVITFKCRQIGEDEKELPLPFVGEGMEYPTIAIGQEAMFLRHLEMADQIRALADIGDERAQKVMRKHIVNQINKKEGL